MINFKLMILFIIMLVFMLTSCETQTTGKTIADTNTNKDTVTEPIGPEKILNDYLSLFNYTGISDKLSKIKLEKELATGYALNSLTLDEGYFNQQKTINSEWAQLCREVEILAKQDVCQGSTYQQWEKIKRDYSVLSKEVTDSSPSSVKIKVRYKQVYYDTLNTNVSEGEVAFILVKENISWKISDFINEKGELASKTSELEKRKQEGANSIQKQKDSIEQVKKMIDELKIKIQKEQEFKDKGYPINHDIQVDYLIYKVTKVETFTEMGTSLLNKKTNGKFVKVYLEITNNAKETKEIFTPRFKIIDNQDRKFDRISDDLFYISDAIEFGKQLQPGLPVAGAIVFELPKDSTNLILSITGDWVYNSEVKVALTNIKDIGRDTTLKEKQDEMMDQIMSDAKKQTDELMKQVQQDSQQNLEDLMNQCISPFVCTSSCPQYMDLGTKNCQSGQVCCLQT